MTKVPGALDVGIAQVSSVVIDGVEFRRVEAVRIEWRGHTQLCGSCSTLLHRGWRYCPTCGRRIAWEVDA